MADKKKAYSIVTHSEIWTCLFGFRFIRSLSATRCGLLYA